MQGKLKIRKEEEMRNLPMQTCVLSFNALENGVLGIVGLSLSPPPPLATDEANASEHIVEQMVDETLEQPAQPHQTTTQARTSTDIYLSHLEALGRQNAQILEQNALILSRLDRENEARRYIIKCNITS
ncbi:unnamed protein product [Linum trigynum]|uniref:Uncharacterized protein n=1 Tax=Linum trigynum TaxID=586398 RepID=A0AAV2E0X7_9ROSI